MSGLDEGRTEAGDVIPSQADILAELKVLRERAGISPARLSERAPLIMGLPLVDDQLDFRRFNPRDRHLAAYTVIGCVLDRIPDVNWRTMLVLSLRYDFRYLSTPEGRKWETARQSGSHEHRTLIIRTIVPYSHSQFWVQLERAYNELANQLLLWTYSPCRDEAPRVAIASARTGRELLAYLLGLLSVEGQQVVRELLAEQIASHLPDGESLRGSTPADTEAAVTDRIFHVLLNLGHPAESEAMAKWAIALIEVYRELAAYSPIERFELNDVLGYQDGAPRNDIDLRDFGRALDMLAGALLGEEVSMPDLPLTESRQNGRTAGSAVESDGTPNPDSQ